MAIWRRDLHQRDVDRQDPAAEEAGNFAQVDGHVPACRWVDAVGGVCRLLLLTFLCGQHADAQVFRSITSQRKPLNTVDRHVLRPSFGHGLAHVGADEEAGGVEDALAVGLHIGGLALDEKKGYIKPFEQRRNAYENSSTHPQHTDLGV